MDMTFLRRLLERLLNSLIGPGNRWRTLFLLFLASNTKNLPLVWHYRFFNAIFHHGLKPKSIPQPTSTSIAFPLFLPVINSTHSPLLECDYNIHKSNSTYFTDLDVSRAHLASLLYSPGRAAYQKRLAAGEEHGRLGIALGGVACFFKREIKPYEKYDIWTRVLSWDEKWVYIVTHFVRRGCVRPKGFLMQPDRQGWWPEWTRMKSNEENVDESEGSGSEGDERSREGGENEKNIFSFAISKYVFKSGRKTILPQTAFENCGLLPPRPQGSEIATPSPGDSSSTGGTMLDEAAISQESLDDLLGESLNISQVRDSGWTWEMVEKERQRGMKTAKLMAGLDQLKEEFTGDSKPALGAYRDLWWV